MKRWAGISICHRRRIEPNFTPETFRQCIPEILLHSNYEETDLEKLGREVALRPVGQTDPGKLAREVGVHPARDNGLVPDQKEHRDDVLAARKVFPGASYGNALRASSAAGRRDSDFLRSAILKELTNIVSSNPSGDGKSYNFSELRIPKSVYWLCDAVIRRACATR
jgi:hypothetical protein